MTTRRPGDYDEAARLADECIVACALNTPKPRGCRATLIGALCDAMDFARAHLAVDAAEQAAQDYCGVCLHAPHRVAACADCKCTVGRRALPEVEPAPLGPWPPWSTPAPAAEPGKREPRAGDVWVFLDGIHSSELVELLPNGDWRTDVGILAAQLFAHNLVRFVRPAPAPVAPATPPKPCGVCTHRRHNGTCDADLGGMNCRCGEPEVAPATTVCGTCKGRTMDHGCPACGTGRQP